ncbi:hypothetical protein SFUL_3687 [Streptomyces microflavus DSM 40593]|uniref:Uncharacterized protein n=1 Tax=Streptomyces microflavus DSM 40593 TaxID=1303692 RepID=N0CSJ1_STRMI|nr:hypothetical protein [Streptomyces microflavus]AGK78605.1 hypothetical protein SFUL_3687 [Streptomyces microflavus DSM 40593]
MTAAVAYAAAPAVAVPCPEPPHAAAGARPRAGGGLRVRVPLRIVVGAQYRDAALSVYIKVAALAMRPEGCTAKVSVLAEYLGLSKSVTERGLKDLARPDEVDGLTEVVTTRRTLRGGRGQSAHRVVRKASETEHFVWIPVRAADALSPRLLRLYALIAYAEARNVPLAVGDLGGMLYHHTGAKAGQHLGARQAARLLEELAATGWITVHARQGLQGRHAYEAHRHPLHPAPLAPAAAPDIHDGSGADDQAGSLASREDQQTDRPVTRTGVGGGIRRRRPTGSRGPGHGEKRSNTSGPRNAEERGDLTRRAWEVLEPVRRELPSVRPFLLRRIDAEIGRQLAAGAGMERLAARLTARWASTEDPRRGDVGRWVLGSGLVRRGCRLDGCESGTTWHTGERCHLCADIAAAEAEHLAPEQPSAPQPEPSPPAPARPPTTWLPMPPPPDPGPAPTPAERKQLRQAATPAAVRQALADLGAAAAIDLYGRALVLPHLTDPEHDGGTPA